MDDVLGYHATGSQSVLYNRPTVLLCVIFCRVLRNFYFSLASRSYITESQAEQDLSDASQTSLHKSYKISGAQKCCLSKRTNSLHRLNKFQFTSWIKCEFNYFEMPVACKGVSMISI